MFASDATIADHIPFSAHVATHVIKTRGGDYLVSWSIQGLPFVGREEWDLDHRHRVFNRLLQSLRAPDNVNVAFWTHDIRTRGGPTQAGSYRHAFNQKLADDYLQLLEQQKLMSNDLYLTMLYRPVVGGKRMREKSADLELLREQETAAVVKALELAENVETTLRDYTPERLGLYEDQAGVARSSALQLFSRLINCSEAPVAALRAPVPAFLPLSRHTFSPRTGDFAVSLPEGGIRYGAILNVKEFPEATWPGVLNGLKYLDLEYVITQSFTPIARQDALRALDRTKGMMISSGDKAVSQLVELDHAMDQLASGNFVLGEYHFTLTVYGDSPAALSSNLATARAELANAGFVAVKEDIAVAAAFYAQLPGNWKYRSRIANVSSLNFLGLSPLHSFATGKRNGNPWGECVATLQAANAQPFHFNFHATHPGENSVGEKAIGNTLVIGKSGTGKTALINFLLSQVQKLRPEPTIFFFDKDRGAEIFVRACGGRYMALESGEPTGFNPLQCDVTETNVQFLCGLVKQLAGKGVYSAREDDDIHRAVVAVMDAPLHLRSMSNLRKSLPDTGDDGLFARLRKWTSSGSLGWVFDNPRDTIDIANANVIGFDYTDILENDEVRAPVVGYLIHRLNELIDGRPIIYVMDEFWKILDGGGALKDFAKNKQKTIRKQNGLGIFATQSPEDALRSDIAAALIEQAATLVLLPNPNASQKDYVDGLKLTESEFKVVKSLDERSRWFLVKQGHASTVCRADLRGLDDALSVLSASTDNVEIMHRVLEEEARRLRVSPDALAPEQWLEAFYGQRKGAGQRRATACDS